MRTSCEECDKAVFDAGSHCIECGRLICDNCLVILYRTKPACRGCAVDFQPHSTDDVAFIQLQLDVVGAFVGQC